MLKCVPSPPQVPSCQTACILLHPDHLQALPACPPESQSAISQSQVPIRTSQCAKRPCTRPQPTPTLQLLQGSAALCQLPSSKPRLPACISQLLALVVVTMASHLVARHPQPPLSDVRCHVIKGVLGQWRRTMQWAIQRQLPSTKWGGCVALQPAVLAYSYHACRGYTLGVLHYNSGHAALLPPGSS
jgi:hypothetical protein